MRRVLASHSDQKDHREIGGLFAHLAKLQLMEYSAFNAMIRINVTGERQEEMRIPQSKP